MGRRIRGKVLGGTLVLGMALGMVNAPAGAQEPLDPGTCDDLHGTLCGSLRSSMCVNLLVLKICREATVNTYEQKKEQ